MPSYQQFIAGSIVSQSIKVFEVPSVQVFMFNPVPGTIIPFGASAPSGILVVAATFSSGPILHAGEMRGRKGDVVGDRRKLGGEPKLFAADGIAVGGRRVAGRHARVLRRGDGRGAGVAGADQFVQLDRGEVLGNRLSAHWSIVTEKVWPGARSFRRRCKA